MPYGLPVTRNSLLYPGGLQQRERDAGNGAYGLQWFDPAANSWLSDDAANEYRVAAQRAAVSGLPTENFSILSDPTYQNPYYTVKDSTGATKYIAPWQWQQETGKSMWGDDRTWSRVDNPYSGQMVKFGNEDFGIAFDTAPSVQYGKDMEDNGLMSFLGDTFSAFAGGPGIPLGAWAGAGAFNSGGLGNFLGSFGNGTSGLVGGAVGGGGGAGGIIGGDMPFNPFADFGSDYFSGAGDFFGGSEGVIPGSYGANGWPSTGIYQNGPTSVNPFNYFSPTNVTWDGGASGTTTIPGLLGNMNGLGSIVGGNNNGFSLPGAALGGLLGLLGANNKPAGTTTTVQDIPDWLKPYVMGNLTAATAKASQLGAETPLLGPGQAEMMKTIQGQYLTPDSNPYLKQTVNDALGQVQSRFNSQYANIAGGGDNMMNSGFQEGLARTLSNTALPMYAQNYQTERGRQLGAATAAPDYTSSQYNAAFSPFSSYANLTKGLGSQTTQPYFTNPMGGALGGAALGSQLGRIFSGGGPFG